MLRERFDKRIHTRADIERLFGMVPLTDLVARGRGKFARIDHDVRAFYHSLRANGPEAVRSSPWSAPTRGTPPSTCRTRWLRWQRARDRRPST